MSTEHSSGASLEPQTAVHVESSEATLAGFWSARLPLHLDRWIPQLGDAFADGAWTIVWRRVTAIGPLAAFGVGLLFPLVYPWMQDVYSESLFFLILIVAASIFSGPLGVMLFFGYILGDLAGGARGYSYGGLRAVGQFGGMVITWMLLAIVVVIVPQLGRRMSEEIAARLSDESGLRVPVRATLYAAATGLLVFLWCQAMIVLIRPVFTWMGSSPTTEAVMQVQRRWGWIAAVAALTAVARLVLEHRARGLAGARIAQLEQQRWSEPAIRAAVWRRTPLMIRVSAAAAVVTLILAGTYGSILDAMVMFAVIAALKAWRAGIFGRLPAWWSAAMRKLPILLRFILAPAIGFAIANVPLRLFWRFDSLRPVMVGAFMTLVIFHLFFPTANKRTTA